MYNFDEIIDRRGSGCLNVDHLKKVFGRDDLLSFWIADMDFKTPDFIIDALKARLDHPILGYPCMGDDYFDVLASWLETLHGWKVSSDQFCFIPGIVKGFAFAERCFLKPGDKVIIQPPVYHPFFYAINNHGRTLVQNPLIDTDEGYVMDYDLLEKQMLSEQPRHVFICAREALNHGSKSQRYNLLSEDEFLQKVIDLGGMNQQILGNRRFLDIYMKPLRADYKIWGQYRYSVTNRLLTDDITMFYSEKDTPFKSVEGWQDLTSGKVVFYEFGDNHFFINNYSKRNWKIY